jgi:hypothetical protein
VTEILMLERDFINNLPGLSNFEYDTNLRINKNNAAMYKVFRDLQSEGQSIIESPPAAYEYFSNISVAVKIDEMVKLSINASKQAASCE